MVTRETDAPAVFLDRDGVLNVPIFSEGRSFAPTRLSDFVLYEDAVESVLRIKKAGFMVVVVTNQPDVGAGKVDISVVEEMHKRLCAEVAIDHMEVCYETRDQATIRRKPGPGMIFDAANKLGLNLSASYLVGDRESDIKAATNAGVVPIFIDRNYTESQPEGHATTVLSLCSATDWIIAHRGTSESNLSADESN